MRPYPCYPGRSKFALACISSSSSAAAHALSSFLIFIIFFLSFFLSSDEHIKPSLTLFFLFLQIHTSNYLSTVTVCDSPRPTHVSKEKHSTQSSTKSSTLTSPRTRSLSPQSSSRLSIIMTSILEIVEAGAWGKSCSVITPRGLGKSNGIRC